MQIPSEAELERLFDKERAAEVQFVETVASWPSLRILDYLYASEPATTGDIARSLNMDMRDVKDRLEALEGHGIVNQADDGWETATGQINITISQTDGLEITHTIGKQPERTDESAQSLTDRFRKFISSLFS